MFKKNVNIIMGIDYGTKKIGIALGQKITNTTKPLETITKNLLLCRILSLVKKWNINTIVLGIPQKETPNKIFLEINKLEFFLRKNGLIIYKISEHLTSWESLKIKKKYKNKTTDSISAAIILQNWFTYYA
jgi:putative Holliday junction resolvase